MRVSSASTYLAMSTSLGAALSRTSAVSAELSSGKTVSRWSDDAPAATAAERYRSQEADYESFGRVATDARGWLATADGTLQSMSSLMTRVRELAVSATNGGLSADGREAIASEVEQLRSQLRDLANSTHLGRPMFAGFGATAVEDDGTTMTWAGDDGRVNRQVSPTISVAVNIPGAALLGFDNPDGDVFSHLTELAAAARSGGNAAVAALHDKLDGSHDRILRGLAEVGVTTNRVEAAADAGHVARNELAGRRSELEDVDIAEAVLRLNAAQAGYQAALGAAAKANLPSLADFLR